MGMSSDVKWSIFNNTLYMPVTFTFQSIYYDLWSKLCIVCINGRYYIYINTYECGHYDSGNQFPINSHSDATVGFVDDKYLFYGYIDDVSIHRTFKHFQITTPFVSIYGNSCINIVWLACSRFLANYTGWTKQLLKWMMLYNVWIMP